MEINNRGMLHKIHGESNVVDKDTWIIRVKMNYR